jgi:hypothetical protein
MNDHGNPPWLANLQWRNGRIHSDAGQAWKALAGFALFWNLMAFAISAGILIDDSLSFPDPAHFILLFPVVGLLLLYFAIKAFRQWRRFGLLNITLDPYPGSIGGEVGGSLTLSARPNTLDDLQVTLSCVRISTSSSSSGSGNRTRHETIVWRQRATSRVELAANGARISFVTKVDPDLPDAEPESDNHKKWVLKLVSKHAGLKRNFDIPVFDTGRSDESRLYLIPSEQKVEPAKFPSDTVRVTRRDDGLELLYPPTRASGPSIALAVIGAIFFGIGLFLGSEAIGAGSAFTSVVVGFMTLVFVPLGLGLLLFGIYKTFNELRVLIGRDTVWVRRRVGPWKSLRAVPSAQLGRLDKTISVQSGQGADAVVYYSLKAGTGGKDLCVGDSIKGQPLADGLLELIREEVGRA